MIRNGAERQNYVKSHFSWSWLVQLFILFVLHPLLGRYFIRVFGRVLSMKYFHKWKINVHLTSGSCVMSMP